MHRRDPVSRHNSGSGHNRSIHSSDHRDEEYIHGQRSSPHGGARCRPIWMSGRAPAVLVKPKKHSPSAAVRSRQSPKRLGLRAENHASGACLTLTASARVPSNVSAPSSSATGLSAASLATAAGPTPDGDACGVVFRTSTQRAGRIARLGPDATCPATQESRSPRIQDLEGFSISRIRDSGSVIT